MKSADRVAQGDPTGKQETIINVYLETQIVQNRKPKQYVCTNRDSAVYRISDAIGYRYVALHSAVVV